MCGTSSHSARGRRARGRGDRGYRMEAKQRASRAERHGGFRLFRKCGSSGHTAAMLGASSPRCAGSRGVFRSPAGDSRGKGEIRRSSGSRCVRKCEKKEQHPANPRTCSFFVWFYFLLSSSLIISLDPSYEKLIDRLRSQFQSAAVVRVFLLNFGRRAQQKFRFPCRRNHDGSNDVRTSSSIFKRDGGTNKRRDPVHSRSSRCRVLISRPLKLIVVRICTRFYVIHYSTGNVKPPIHYARYAP